MIRRLVAFVLLVAVGALVVAAGALGLWHYARSWHPSDRQFPVQGIDVSHHQGVIDWPTVAAQHVDFAYIKATEGGDFRDRRFARNWQQAGKAGIPRGAYHFFTLCRSGAEQAANFIAVVPADPQALPPAVDLEFSAYCTKRPPRAAMLRELTEFLQRVEAHSGKPALLYLMEDFDRAYQVSTAVKRPLWLRRLYFQPDFGARDWTVWQASNMRRVRGIEGRVDWNAARLDLARITPSFGRDVKAETLH